MSRRYSVLVYHRLAGEGRPGQERIDMPPETFARQLRTLRRAGFRFLTLAELTDFHLAGRPLPGRRAVVLTLDDATADVVEPLTAGEELNAHVFVPTAEVGRAVEWLDGARLAGWDDLAALATAGVAVGAHSRTHPEDLTVLGDAELVREVAGSRDELAERLGAPPLAFAYPHGRHDERVRRVVAEAGFILAFTTTAGLNDAATDRFALRRVSPKTWDSRLSILWKAATARPVPRFWERWLVRRHAALRRLSTPRRDRR
jgi:peptidoglycan/xylan/chitin deacetylase (PgdA/CDA1 family)